MAKNNGMPSWIKDNVKADYATAKRNALANLALVKAVITKKLDTTLDYGDVGDMNRIADQLKRMVSE